MKTQLLLTVITAACLTSGCVTETTGRQMPEASDTEAAQINLQLGVGYLREGNLEAAQSKLEKAVDQDPDLIAAHTALALVYERLGDIEGAEREYRRAIDMAPRDPDALNYMASFLCRQPGRQGDAHDYYERALAVPLSEKYSNKAMIYTNAGVCAKRTDLVQAEDYLRTALANDPRYAEALLQMADVTYERGHYLQSRAFLERYISAARVSPAVLWLGVRVETALGDADAAANYGTRLKREFPESVETRLLLEQERNAG